MGREYLSTNLSTKAHFLHQLKRDKTLLTPGTGTECATSSPSVMLRIVTTLLPCSAPVEEECQATVDSSPVSAPPSSKWINLSTLSSEVKVTTKIAGIVYNIQQLEEEIEMPDTWNP
jgi:hypothetical protein